MTTTERIKNLESELLRLRRIEEIENFKNHMKNTFDVLMGDGCTDASCTLFYNMPFTITFNGKTVNVANYADTFQIVEDLLQTEIDDLKED